MKTIFIAVLSLLIATPALAARPGHYYDPYDSRSSGSRMDKSNKIYIGVSGGVHSTDYPNISAAATTTTTTAYSVFAGYSFNDYIATELGYTNLGKMDLDLVGPSTSFTGTAAGFSVVASMPLGKVASLFVKGGYASTSTEQTLSGVVQPSESASGGAYGAGIQFNAGSRVGIRLGYDSYPMISNLVSYRSNVSSLGLMFKF